MPPVIHKSVSAVEFGFLSADEIQTLSVKQITEPFVFDQLDQPVPNGLYDRAMGPTSQFENCQTCGLPESECLGHMGHITLSLEVYHPLLFDVLFKLLRSKCFNCHKLRIKSIHLIHFQAIFYLLKAGMVEKARECFDDSIIFLEEDKENKSNDSDKKDKDEDQDAKSKAEDVKSKKKKSDAAAPSDPVNEFRQRMHDYIKLAKSKLGHLAKGDIHDSCTVQNNSTATECRQQMLKEFFSLIGSKKCPWCQATSPKIRKVGTSKIFMIPLEAKAIKAMELSGIHLEVELYGLLIEGDQGTLSALKGGKKGDDKEKKAATKKKAKKKKGDSDAEEESSSEEEEEEEEKEEQEDEDEGGDVDAEVRPLVLFPNIVSKHMQLLWHECGDILSLIWPAFGGAVLANSVHPGPQSFFLKTLAVPPPRFRPAVKFQGEIMDSAQNVCYKRILEADKKVKQLSLLSQQQRNSASPSKPKKDAQEQISNGKDAKPVKQEAGPVNFGYVASQWFELQEAVNHLIDSTKTAAAAKGEKVTPGIRQLLEKKQGLFRMNMMGKRVNFACRSVISPDPWIHTREIGIPEHFARELTYPQPVTSWNVHELREAVINGPDVHPGANFLEDESGNRIDLSTRNKEQRIALSKTLMTAGLYHKMGKEDKAVRAAGASATSGVKKVLRHLKDGDVLLANRQPTLHKPSMMSHKARVLRNKGQQTIRMHYANCNT
jgi:DNA-directed RNA polymerase I subunit RPA1